jgi:hypothetical protein
MDGFTYTQSHLLNLISEITDYQIKFIVYKANGTSNSNIIYCKSHCKDDFTDLRFSIDEVTALPYWIESYVSGTSAIIWVKFTTISTSQTMYVHYGKPAATSESNGDNTFLFFDDFSGTLNTTKWTTPASYTLSSGTIALGVASNGANALCSQNAYDLSSYIIVGKQKISDITPGQYLMCGFNTAKQSHANGTYQASFTLWAATRYFMTRCVGTGTTCTGMDGVATDSNLYYRTELHNSINTIDYVFLRKHAATEPTHSTWGAEVSASPVLCKSYVINMW